MTAAPMARTRNPGAAGARPTPAAVFDALTLPDLPLRHRNSVMTDPAATHLIRRRPSGRAAGAGRRRASGAARLYARSRPQWPDGGLGATRTRPVAPAVAAATFKGSSARPRRLRWRPRRGRPAGREDCIPARGQRLGRGPESRLPGTSSSATRETPGAQPGARGTWSAPLAGRTARPTDRGGEASALPVRRLRTRDRPDECPQTKRKILLKDTLFTSLLKVQLRDPFYPSRSAPCRPPAAQAGGRSQKGRRGSPVLSHPLAGGRCRTANGRATGLALPSAQLSP